MNSKPFIQVMCFRLSWSLYRNVSDIKVYQYSTGGYRSEHCRTVEVQYNANLEHYVEKDNIEYKEQ